MKTLPLKPCRMHVAGIAGVGMNAVAQALLGSGYHVSGSDRMIDQGTDAPVLRRLRNMGITLFPQDGTALSQGIANLVISTAIEPDNPEWSAARERDIPVWHRAELLAALIGPDTCVAVAGTSGKTTVTGMLGWTLTACGWSPNVVNGGGILNWQSETSPGNVSMTGTDRWVVEVDESDRSLLRFHPDWTILTNISRDHFTLEESQKLFCDYAAQVKTGIVAPLDVAALLRADERITADIFGVEVDTPERVPLQVPGVHNQLNAKLVRELCRRLGMVDDAIHHALSAFAGIERRLEKVGVARDVTVYDEYAHNPAKIRAAWLALAQAHPRVRGVWRPHGFGPLAAMADDLVAMWSNTCRPHDRVYVLPVYFAGGTVTKTLDALAFVERLVAAGVPAEYVADYNIAASRMLDAYQPGDALCCIGARDPMLPVFARQLVEKLT